MRALCLPDDQRHPRSKRQVACGDGYGRAWGYVPATHKAAAAKRLAAITHDLPVIYGLRHGIGLIDVRPASSWK